MFDKPTYRGYTVLELSKLPIFGFYLKDPAFSVKSLQFQCMDTDSF